MSQRADRLAERIEQGAKTLLIFAEGLSDAEWATPCPGDGRTVGVLVHHVASMYLAEIDMVRMLASGTAVVDVTWDMVDEINARHAHDFVQVGKTEVLDLLQRNSKLIADAVRALTDEQLDQVAPISLHRNAPLTTQYFIEEHPLSHSFHHLIDIRKALNKTHV